MAFSCNSSCDDQFRNTPQHVIPLISMPQAKALFSPSSSHEVMIMHGNTTHHTTTFDVSWNPNQCWPVMPRSLLPSAAASCQPDCHMRCKTAPCGTHVLKYFGYPAIMPVAHQATHTPSLNPCTQISAALQSLQPSCQPMSFGPQGAPFQSTLRPLISPLMSHISIHAVCMFSGRACRWALQPNNPYPSPTTEPTVPITHATSISLLQRCIRRQAAMRCAGPTTESGAGRSLQPLRPRVPAN